MKVIKIGEQCVCLNVRQLLNPIFFTGIWPLPSKKHPDSTRQRRAVQRARGLTVARELKRRFEYVPLCLVDRTVYPRDYDTWKTVTL